MHLNLGRAAAGGLVGTVAITAMMYLVAPMMMGMRMDIAAMLGSMLGGHWWAGMTVHFILGSVVFPTVYVGVLYQHLRGSPVVRGTVWGIILWLLAQLIVMPMMGGGLFSSQMGGAMAAAGSLVGHVIYGSLLGGIAGEPTGVGPRVAAGAR